MKVDYTLLDVFTRHKFAGNPLAVVPRGDGLLDTQMQQIARELNLSETIFICAPASAAHTASVRIFTPQVELPFAGHPTVGAAVHLGLERGASAVRLEERVGVITCVIEKIDKLRAHARFSLPLLPQVAGRAPDLLQIAVRLGLEPEDIGCLHHKPAVYTAGVTYYCVPVKSADVLARMSPQAEGWAHSFPLGHHAVYAYTITPDEPDNDYAARMFGPGMGLGEDPATGSAAAALIGEFALTARDGLTEMVIRQGLEMGRPSRIHVQLRKDDDKLVHGAIGGDAVVVGQGSLDIDD